MIVELAVGLTLVLSDVEGPYISAQFSEPVQEVVLYPPGGELTFLTNVDLPVDVAEAFEREFVADTLYFGAFAITKDFGYGYVAGANSIEAARDIALQECLKHGPRCLLFAEITPIGYEDRMPGQVTMSAEAANYYQNPDPSWGNFRAMAISEDGAYSVVWNYGSRNEAANAALSDCGGYVINDLPGLREMPCVLIPFK